MPGRATPAAGPRAWLRVSYSTLLLRLSDWAVRRGLKRLAEPADGGCWVEYAFRTKLDAAPGHGCSNRAPAAGSVLQASDRIRIQPCGRKLPWPQRRPK